MWKVQLIIVSIKRCEQIKTLIKRAIGFRIRLINFVEHNNRAQSQRQSF